MQDLVLSIPPLCRTCSYDLADTDADRCPECGAPIPRGLTRSAIRELTQDERDATHALIRSRSTVTIAVVAYLVIIVITAALVIGFARTPVPASLAIAVGAFGLFVVIAPLPYLRGRVNDFRRRQARMTGDIDRDVIEILQLPIRRAIRIGQPRGSDITVAGRTPPDTGDLTTWFLLLEGDADTWAILSPHCLRAHLNDKPTTCPNTLHIERTPRAGVVVHTCLDGESISIEGATTHISSQRITSDIEICHRDQLRRLVTVLGSKPWD